MGYTSLTADDPGRRSLATRRRLLRELSLAIAELRGIADQRYVGEPSLAHPAIARRVVSAYTRCVDLNAIARYDELDDGQPTLPSVTHEPRAVV